MCGDGTPTPDSAPEDVEATAAPGAPPVRPEAPAAPGSDDPDGPAGSAVPGRVRSRLPGSAVPTIGRPVRANGPVAGPPPPPFVRAGAESDASSAAVARGALRAVRAGSGAPLARPTSIWGPESCPPPIDRGTGLASIRRSSVAAVRWRGATSADFETSEPAGARVGTPVPAPAVGRAWAVSSLILGVVLSTTTGARAAGRAGSGSGTSPVGPSARFGAGMASGSGLENCLRGFASAFGVSRGTRSSRAAFGESGWGACSQAGDLSRGRLPVAEAS